MPARRKNFLSPTDLDPPPRGAYSIKQFAQAHGLSESMVFKLMRDGRGPRLLRLGRRTLITVEAAAEWRAAHERATAAASATVAA